MKMDRKTKAEKTLPKIRAVKGSQRVATPKTNGNHPLASYQNLPMGIVEASLKGKYVDANEEFCRILGYPKKELLRLSIKDCTYEDDYATESGLHKQLVAGEIPFYRLEKRYVRKDGDSIWVELTRTLICDAEEKPIYTLGVVLDISERKQAEVQTKWQAHLLAELGDAVLATDHQFVITSWNKAAERIYGWKAEEVLGRKAADFLQTDFLGKTREEIVEQSEETGAFSGEITQLRKDGTRIVIEARSIAIRDDKNTIVGYVSVNRDITERKHAEQSLRESQQLLAETYKYAPIGIVEASVDGRHMNVNDEFCHILGYDRVELLEGSIKDFTHEDDLAIDVNMHQQLVAGKLPFYRLEKRFLRKQGGDVWVELTRSLVRDPQEKPLYTIGAVLDISDRKHVERVLRESVERLRLATEAARMFTWEWDFQRQNYTVPDNFEQVLGFSTGLLPKNDLETAQRLLPEEDMRRVVKAFAEAIENHSDVHSLPCRVINLGDNQMVWLEISAKIVYDADGNLERMFGVAQNITENKKAQEKLRESEERFRALVSQATAGIAQSNMDSTLTFVNPRFCEMLGYSEEELLGKTIWELTYTEDIEENKRLFEGMLKRGESYQFEKRFIRRDGSPLWTSVSVSTIYDLDRKPKGGVGVVIDIEERKRAEKALTEFARQQEALYQLADQLHRTGSLEGVFNAALDAILSALQCDRASILLYDNASEMHFVAWRGLSDGYRKATDGHSPWKPDETNPEPISVSDVRTAEFSDSLKEVIEAEGVSSLAFIPLVSDGKLIGKFMVYFDTPHAFSEGEIDLSLTIAHQLAFGIERRRSEEALARERELLERLFETMPVMVSISDPATSLPKFNSHFEKLIGWNMEEVSLLSLLEACYPDPEYRKHIAQRMAACDEGEWIDVRMQTRDGRTLDTTWSNMHFSNGMNVGIGIDISERQQAENRLTLLAEISETLRNIEDPQELLYAVSKAVGEHFQVRRCLFNEIDPEHDRETVHRDYYNGIPSVAGVHKITDYSSITTAEMQSGKTVVNTDSKTDPRTMQDYEKTYEPSRERSYVAVPLMREHRWVASLWISDDEPRQWSQDEVSLLEAIAERTWVAVEKLRLTEELRAKESELEDIINHTPFMLTRCSRDLRYRFVSRAYAEMIGRTPEELAGQPIAEIMGEAGLQTILPYIEKVLQGESVEYEAEVSFQEVGVPFLHVVYTPDRDEHGNVIGWFGSIVDISERKRTEEALRIENERFMRFVNSNIVGILIGNASGEVILANDYYLRLLGVSRQEFTEGKADWKKFTPPEWLPADEKAIRELHERGVCEPYEKEYVRTDGTRVPVYVADALLPGPGKEIAAFVLDISERKRAEEALRASEALYRAIARSIPGGGVYVVDKDYRYLVAEGAVSDMFGLSREMLEGHTVSEVYTEEQATRMEVRLQQNFAGETVNFETEHNGRVYWTQQAPLMDSIGQAIIVTIDITERKQAEEALRESDERFRAILRQATAGIVRKDEEGRLIFVNQAFCNMLGYTEAELLGKTIWDFMHEDDIEENKRLYNRLMVEGIPFKLERRLIREDGSTIWLDASVSPIMDAEGKSQSAVAVEVDITGRKRAEEDLQQLNLQLEERVLSRTAKLRSVNQTLRDEIAERKRVEEALRQSEAAARSNEEKLSTLFDLLPVGISFLDPEGQIIQMNSALLNIVKLSKEELVNKSHRARKYIRADGTAMPPTEFASARALAEEKTIHNVETGILLENGEVIWTNVSAAPVDVANVGAVVVTVDITDSKHAERALQESHRRLRVLSQRLVEVQEDERRALARELHDRVGQTLAALNINLIIINSQLSAEVSEQIGTRLNDSMKLVAETIALVRDVMTDLRPAVLDDYGLEAALESHLAQFMSRYDINVKFEKPDRPIPRLGPSIEMTCLRIAQEALMNIARHAQATQVSVSLRQEEDAVYMTVQDNGIGIESWQEANRPGSHGLTIMRERAEAFNGDLRVRSVPGQGTKIELSIPLKDQNHVREEK